MYGFLIHTVAISLELFFAMPSHAVCELPLASLMCVFNAHYAQPTHALY